MILTKNEKTFLSDLTCKCLENNISLVLKNQKKINKCSGYFDEKTLAAALKCFDGRRDEVMGVIVHESCHMDQFLEKIPLWYDPIFNEGDLWEEYNNKKINKSKKLELFMKKLLEIELDCEKRAVEKIKKYDLPLDIPEYIQRGNIYLYAYRVFYEYRAYVGWYTSLMRDDNIVSKMPTEYLSVSEYWRKNTNPVIKYY